MNNLMMDILEKSKKEKTLVSIWTYDDSDGFWSGFIKSFTKEFITIQHFTKYGKPDGLIIEKLDNIQSVDFENDYSKSMAFLIKNSRKIELEQEIAIVIENSDLWQKDILEDYIGNKKVMVRVKNNGVFYIGFVQWCDEEHLIINAVGSEGQNDGKSLLKLRDIDTIRVNDIDCRKRLLLFNWRYSKSK